MPTTSKSATLKQAKLSFASSKRTAVTAAKAVQKPKLAQSRSPSVAQITPAAQTEDDDKKERIKNSGSSSSESEEEKSVDPPPRRPRLKSAQEQVVPSKDENIHPNSPLPELDETNPTFRKLHAAARAKMGHLTPIHSAGENKLHEILRIFDLTSEFGPYVGVTRLERWERAFYLGLNPPDEVRQILTTKQGTEDFSYSQSVMYGQV